MLLSVSWDILTLHEDNLLQALHILTTYSDIKGQGYTITKEFGEVEQIEHFRLLLLGGRRPDSSEIKSVTF